MPIRAIVFDIGGIFEIIPGGGDPSSRFPQLLADWDERLNAEPGTLARQMAELDDRLTAEGKDGAIGTCTEEEFLLRLREVTGMDGITFETFMHDFWDTYMGDPNTELIDYFRTLRPRFRTAILSNSFVGAREHEEERLHLSELAEFIVYSHESGFSKPDPRIYQLVYSRLGIQPDEMIFLDDVERNVEAAHALGIHVIHFKDNAQAIGDIEACIKQQEAS